MRWPVRIGGGGRGGLRCGALAAQQPPGTTRGSVHREKFCEHLPGGAWQKSKAGGARNRECPKQRARPAPTPAIDSGQRCLRPPISSSTATACTGDGGRRFEGPTCCAATPGERPLEPTGRDGKRCEPGRPPPRPRRAAPRTAAWPRKRARVGAGAATPLRVGGAAAYVLRARHHRPAPPEATDS